MTRMKKDRRTRRPTPVARGRIRVEAHAAGETVYVDGARFWDGPPMKATAVVRALVRHGEYHGEMPAEHPPEPEPEPEPACTCGPYKPCPPCAEREEAFDRDADAARRYHERAELADVRTGPPLRFDPAGPFLSLP